jgi:hypothetical protein
MKSSNKIGMLYTPSEIFSLSHILRELSAEVGKK